MYKSVIALFLLFFLLSCSKENSARTKNQNFNDLVNKAVVYELFVRDFTPEGTFKATEEKVPYLKKLGVDIIWLMPIYPIGEKGRKGTLGSPYSVQNFFEVNTEFGTKEDFRSLVKAIHKAGMKVIIGFVPNHSSNDYIEMKNHPDWFMRDKDGNFTREVKDWTDITDFNYDNPELRKYIFSIMKYWIQEFDIDGYRCDVAGLVPDDFWREAIPEIKKIKKDLFLLAEWEDKKFIDFGFTADYSWSILHTLRDLHQNKKKVSDLVQIYSKKLKKYRPNGLFMNFLENHDEPRSVILFGKNHIEPYATFSFTTPGIPLLLMGQEFGDTSYNSWRSLFEKEVLDWEHFDSSLYNMYSKLIQIHHSFPINESQWDTLMIMDKEKILGYSLTSPSEEKLIILLNFSGQEQTLKVSEIYKEGIELKGEYHELLHGKKITLEEDLALPPYSASILKKR